MTSTQTPRGDTRAGSLAGCVALVTGGTAGTGGEIPQNLHRTGGRYALATMRIGGGQGIPAIFERMSPTAAGSERSNKEERNVRT